MKELKDRIKIILEKEKVGKFTARQIQDALDEAGLINDSDNLKAVRSTMNKFFKERYIITTS